MTLRSLLAQERGLKQMTVGERIKQLSRSLYRSVDWNGSVSSGLTTKDRRSLYRSVDWNFLALIIRPNLWSLLVQERGLKHHRRFFLLSADRRSLYRSVDWNTIQHAKNFESFKSLLVQERGLKHCFLLVYTLETLSLLVQERGLKPLTPTSLPAFSLSLLLQECGLKQSFYIC